ncbi:MAG: HAD family hydrolase [Rhodobacteraceae bacterium]|nr:HAD family hydrolase [Paracoccaceae bacterium]MBT6521940.1 HAD family hydrolase [Paracoccaceae bacterium]
MERASLPSSIKILGLDADDTLWQNEEFFRLTQDRFADMLSAYMPPDPLHEELLAAERRNLGRYGYGIKGFVLSMVETAIDVSKGQVPAHVIHDILVMGRDMLNHPIHLLPGVAECLPKLAEDYALVLVTKGDLLHQEQKLAQSGLGDLFDDVHIVSEKQITTYQRIFGAQLPATAMIGNSIKSDILPALAAGAAAIHIPGRYEWEMEKASAPPDGPRFFKASSFNKVSALLSEI